MIISSKSIVIKLSKTKILLLLIGSLAFVTFFICLCFFGGSQAGNDVIWVKIAGVIAPGLFSQCGLYYGKKLFDEKPGLIIDNIGIQDNSSAFGTTLVKWENIEGFKIEQVRSTRLLLIMVNNADELIAQESGWRRKLLNINKSMYATPITIASNSLQCNFDQLVELLFDRFHAVKG